MPRNSATRLHGDAEIVAATPAAWREKVAVYLRELHDGGGDKPAAVAAWRAAGLTPRELLGVGVVLFDALDFHAGYAGRRWAAICRVALAMLDAKWPDDSPDRLARRLGDDESVTYQARRGADEPWRDETRTRDDLAASLRRTAETANTIVALLFAEHNAGRLLAKHESFFKGDPRWLDHAADCWERDLLNDLLQAASPRVRGLWNMGPLAGDVTPHALDLPGLLAESGVFGRESPPQGAEAGGGGAVTINLSGPPFAADAHDALKPRGDRGIGSDRAATLLRWLPDYDLAAGWSAQLTGAARTALADLRDVRPDLLDQPFGPGDVAALGRAAAVLLRRQGFFCFETSGDSARLFESLHSSLGDLMIGLAPEVLATAVPPAAGRVAAGFLPGDNGEPHPAEAVLREMSHAPHELSVPAETTDPADREGYDTGLYMVGYRGWSVPPADLVAAVAGCGRDELAGDAAMLGLLLSALPPDLRVSAFVGDNAVVRVEEYEEEKEAK